MKKTLKATALMLALVFSITCLFAGCGDKDSDKSDKESTGGGAKISSCEDIIALMEKEANAKEFDKYSSLDILNGFCQDEVTAIYKLSEEAENYESKEEAKFNTQIATYKRDYGSDYKFTFKITSTRDLDEEEVGENQDSFRKIGEELETVIKTTEDWDDSDWDSLSAYLDGVGVENAKKYVNYITDISEVLKECKITEGYSITYTKTTSGSKLDEDIVEETEDYEIVNVNGSLIPVRDALIFAVFSYPISYVNGNY